MDFGRVFMLLQIVELARAHGPNTPIGKIGKIAEQHLSEMLQEDAEPETEDEVTYADNNPAPTEREEESQEDEDE